MPALLNYIYTQFNRRPDKQAFISDPPGPAILLWTNNNTYPNLTGISVVREINSQTSSQNRLNSQNLINIIANQIHHNTAIPFLDIEYDFINESLIINQIPYNLSNGGEFIARTFNLTINNSLAKAQNATGAINDPFHIWSRNFFSGQTVKKIDLDLVIIDLNQNSISSMVEVKRSAKANFNKWQPYTNDLHNYEMMFALSNALNSPFYTIHHNETMHSLIDPNKLVNMYTYNPTSQFPMNWNTFRNLQNRQQISAQAAVNLL